MKESRLKVEEVATGSLVPYAGNAKMHPHEQVDQIAKSIEEFGFSDPVGVWTNPEGELEIVEGHGRVLAARKLGLETVPVVRLDHLTDEQRRAYTHVHNQTTLNSGFDFEILDSELETLDYDFEEFGFHTLSGIDIEDFFVRSASADDGETQEDPARDGDARICPYCGREI